MKFNGLEQQWAVGNEGSNFVCWFWKFKGNHFKVSLIVWMFLKLCLVAAKRIVYHGMWVPCSFYYGISTNFSDPRESGQGLWNKNWGNGQLKNWPSILGTLWSSLWQILIKFIFTEALHEYIHPSVRSNWNTNNNATLPGLTRDGTAVMSPPNRSKAVCTSRWSEMTKNSQYIRGGTKLN